MSIRTLNSKSLAALAFAALLVLAPAIAEAKMGGGMSSGSRGSRTFSAPPATNTAPRSAAPMERSIAPQAAPSQNRQAFNPARSQSPAGGLFGGSFGRGLLGGLAGGLLGAGLIGLFTGHGLFGGLGEFSSIIGLLLQIALIYFLARLAFNWFAGRKLAGAMSGAPGASGARPGFAAFSGAGFGGGGAAPQRPASSPLTPRPEDFNAFERLLGETQAAYSAQDIARLHQLATPEMVSYFSEDIAANARKGVENRISGVKLLQGDLSEAWREGADEYATVAMRFSLIDVFVDKASGNVVSGDPARPIESTEIWTFRRPAGRGPEAWKLSAIQQTA
jgi:predicted lipid-binding transport protein (Tim44 family)